jgi:hypothetical protein
MRGVGAVSLGLAFSSIVGGAWAGEVCARAQDLTALQVASVQQHLMVAALACNDAGLYNTFVVTYRDDLQASDATLKAFFARLGEATGKSEYDTFKTKLANDYSLNSNRNKTFCRSALAVFRAALNEKKTTLASFALSQPIAIDHNYRTCGDEVEGGAMTMKPAILASDPPKPPSPVKQENPISSSTAQADSVPPAPVAKNNDAPSSSGPYATRTYDSHYDNRQTYGYSQQAPQYTQQAPQYSQQPPQYSQQSPSRTYRYPARNPYAVYPYAANPYARSYSDDYYSYCSRYGERDPYCRNPYARYWYGGYPPQSYLRRP